jgi:hypothetical protein
MAAVLFLVVILGLLVAGRAQAIAAEDGSALRFQVWQLGAGAVVLLAFAAHFALGTPLPVASGGISMVKGVGLLAALAVLAVFVFRARSSEDF